MQKCNKNVSSITLPKKLKMTFWQIFDTIFGILIPLSAVWATLHFFLELKKERPQEFYDEILRLSLEEQEERKKERKEFYKKLRTPLKSWSDFWSSFPEIEKGGYVYYT